MIEFSPFRKKEITLVKDLIIFRTPKRLILVFIQIKKSFFLTNSIEKSNTWFSILFRVAFRLTMDSKATDKFIIFLVFKPFAHDSFIRLLISIIFTS